MEAREPNSFLEKVGRLWMLIPPLAHLGYLWFEYTESLLASVGHMVQAGL